MCLTSKKVLPKQLTLSPDFHTSDACCTRMVNRMCFESVSIERPPQIVQTKSTSTVCDAVTSHGTTSKMLSLCTGTFFWDTRYMHKFELFVDKKQRQKLSSKESRIS